MEDNYLPMIQPYSLMMHKQPITIKKDNKYKSNSKKNKMLNSSMKVKKMECRKLSKVKTNNENVLNSNIN